MIPLALLLGFALDLLLGDPPRWPHCVVAIGKMIAWLEKTIRSALPPTSRWELAGGGVLVALVAAVSFGIPFFALAALARAHPRAALALEIVVCYQVLATKCLRDAGLRVYRALADGDLPRAREAVAMIVGRDAAGLDEEGVIRAAVETVAENASDGVVAPMLYFTVGGAPLAILYKAINTMDSMLGYKNDTYLYFGRIAAKIDDVANYLPARITGALMVLAAALCRFDWRNALRICRRDRRAHASPNSGYPEAACAGALGVRLGGDAMYGGRLIAKPTLGDRVREVEPEDIRRAARLLYAAAVLCLVLCCGGYLLIAALFRGYAPWN